MTLKLVANEIQQSNTAESIAALKSDYLKAHTYEQLSLEFEKVAPFAIRAFELIPLMYNRLTLIDGLSHKNAFTRIVRDHKQHRGFAARNIRRYLPRDNPNVPHRVRTSRPKNESNQRSDDDTHDKHSQVGVLAILLERIGESLEYVNRLPDKMQEDYAKIAVEYCLRGHLGPRQHLQLVHVLAAISFLKGRDSMRVSS